MIYILDEKALFSIFMLGMIIGAGSMAYLEWVCK